MSLASVVLVFFALFSSLGLDSRISDTGFGFDGAARVEPLDDSLVIVERRADAMAMLETVNAERAGRGLQPLALDNRLVAIARSHAVDMAERRYFGHETPEGLSPFARMSRAHYRFSYAGENLALDRSESAAARALWNSTEHRSNILQPHFSRVGIAAVTTRDGEIFVQDFSD